MDSPLPASPAQEELRRQLFADKLLFDSGIPGVVGQSETFVDIRERVDALVTRLAAADRPERMSFPPVMPVDLFRSTGYLRSFPHLAATLCSFVGTELDAAEQADRADRGDDWAQFQQQTGLAMVPAACHPVYAAVATRGPLPAHGVVIDAGPAFVFRHEPSLDPARLQSFRQREIVRIGPAEKVIEWRDTWRDRAVNALSDLGLDVIATEANDPFFGRSGRLLAANQRAQALKFEVLGAIAAPDRTALASFNYHLDHFCLHNDITLVSDEPAHTACLGFGLERIVLALLASHGSDPARWPETVRDQLWH